MGTLAASPAEKKNINKINEIYSWQQLRPTLLNPL